MQTVRVFKETNFRLSECKKHLTDVNYSSLYRWSKVGFGPAAKKVYLDVGRKGRTLYTSIEAYERFLKQINKEDQ